MVRRFSGFIFTIALIGSPAVFAEGESIDGFPNWYERTLLTWINRARIDPAAELASCPDGVCGEKACYGGTTPYVSDPSLNRSARFHAAHMGINGYTDTPSHCTLPTGIATLYPDTCNGAASCACTQGMLTTDSSTWTDLTTRESYFGFDTRGGTGRELISPLAADPVETYNSWMFEPSSATSCGLHGTANFERYVFLTPFTNFMGIGMQPGSARTVADEGTLGVPTAKVTGSHYPKQGATVDVWATWYDWQFQQDPNIYYLNVDGQCHDMTVERGILRRGAFHSQVSNVGSGCHRYVFAFKDATNKEFVYPTKGSYTIGAESAQCPDYSLQSPPGCPGFDLIFSSGLEP